MKCCAQDPIRHTCCLGLALTADSYTSSHYRNLFGENRFVSVASIGVVINHPVGFQAFYSIPIAPSRERVIEAAQYMPVTVNDRIPSRVLAISLRKCAHCTN